ncbi:MAG: Ldh family oxidoreductase, partial [Chloroflexota bacterium]
IGVAARDGHELPLGIGLDSEGNPTTDAKKIHQGGVILPFGGYKGSAIATMIELFSAGVVGDYFSFEALEADKDADGKRDGGPARGGQFIMAMAPEVLAGSDWAEHSESFFAKLEGMDGIRIPGARRFANRKSTAPREINAELVEKIKRLTKV